MNRLRVLDVRVFNDAESLVQRMTREAPLAGLETNQATLRFLAWFVAPVGSFDTVGAYWGGRCLGVAPLLPRLDVPMLEFPQGMRAYGVELTPFLGPFESEGEYSILLRANGPTGEQDLCTWTIAFVPFRGLLPSFSGLQPILMVSGGRVGSSVFMGALGAHPQIVVSGKVPYENKTAAYMSHVARLQISPPNYPQSERAFGFESDFFKIGFSPYSGSEFLLRGAPESEYLTTTYPLEVVNFYREASSAFYSTIALSHGNSDAAFFAEKLSGGFVPWWLAECFPKSHVLFLVRDPRDMICSMMAFDEKRGFYEFTGSADADFGGLVGQLSTIAHSWISEVESRKNILVVRYEDLILEPRRIGVELYTHLGLDSSQPRIDEFESAIVGTFETSKNHVTSLSAKASIGRWRNELSATQAVAANTAFEQIISFFGYNAF